MKLLISHEDWIKKEIEKCKNDLHYFYLNYNLIGGEKPILREQDKAFFNWWMKVTSNPNIKGVINTRRRPRL